MKRREARRQACALWSVRADVFGGWSRVGYVLIRRKTVKDRFEVGYMEQYSDIPSKEWRVVLLGKGSSWEEAFHYACSPPNELLTSAS